MVSSGLQGVATAHEIGKRRHVAEVACLLCAMAVHTAAVCYFLPPSFAVDRRPVLFADYTVHFRSSLIFRETLRHGTTWAYDPLLMAGYPANIFEGVDNHATELFVALLGGSQPVIAFKVWLLTGFLAFPLLVGVAAWLFRFDSWTIVTSVWLAALIWALDPHAVLFRQFGGFSFLLVSPLVLVASALAWQTLRTGRPGAVVAFGVVTAIITWVHIVGLLLVAAATLMLVITGVARLDPRRVGSLACAGVLAVLPALWWLVPLAENLRWKVDSSNRLAATGLHDLVKLLLFAPGTRFQSLVVWLGLVGLVLVARTSRTLAWWLAVCTAGVALAVFTPVGRLRPVAQLQPQRFLLIGVVLLAVPAALLVVTLGRRLGRGARWLALAPLATCASAFQHLPWLQVAAHAPLRAPSLVDRAAVPAAAAFLWPWLQALPGQGRVLLEDMDEISNKAYGGSYIGGLWPVLNPVPLLGGPNELPYRQQVVDLTDGRWLGSPIASLSEGALRRCLDRYAVAWIVAVRPDTVNALDRFPAVIQRAGAGAGCVVYRVLAPQPLADGGCTVTLELGRVIVRGALQPATLVRVHWHQALRAVPPLRIERVTFPDDPVGLVRVHNGDVRDFVLASPGFSSPGR